MNASKAAAARPRSRLLGVVLVVLLVAPGLLTAVGCSSSEVAYDDSGAWAHTQQQQLLDQRARAIRTHDIGLFMSTVARGDAAFVTRQRHYFRGITQLPLGRVGFTALSSPWPSSYLPDGLPGDAVALRVRQVLQLTGFDTVPEVSITGLVVAQRGGVWKVVADRASAGRPFPGHTPQPWEVAPVHVERRGDVLGVFDDTSIRYADVLLPVVARAIVQDQAALPFWWSGRVVVYCFADTRLLDSFRRVPGGNIRDLGAMSFPVYANAAGTRVTGMRFVVLPAAVGVGGIYLDRLVRHELTHVALGTRDDGAPTWFIEGIAEYMGARPLTRAERRIPSVAVVEAARPVDRMPASASFNGPDQDWHYALSWMACDYIAARFGEATLWNLMDAFHAAHGGDPDQRQDGVLEREIRMSSAQLAAHAAARIRNLYG